MFSSTEDKMCIIDFEVGGLILHLYIVKNTLLDILFILTYF